MTHVFWVVKWIFILNLGSFVYSFSRWGHIKPAKQLVRKLHSFTIILKVYSLNQASLHLRSSSRLKRKYKSTSILVAIWVRIRSLMFQSQLQVGVEAAVPIYFSQYVFLKCLQYSQESTCIGVSFYKVAGLKTCTFIKKRHQHKCFTVNIAKFLRTAFL